LEDVRINIPADVCIHHLGGTTRVNIGKSYISIQMHTNTIGKIREKKDRGLYENMQIFQEKISKYPKYSKKRAIKT